ncbi:MAG: RNA ligase partner protein [Patescibacteria group bacterium]|nr:RNA ligase partner protein [Patescibacteria group bacterium]
MEKFIIDTNVFFNMQAGFNLGKTTNEVIKNFSKLIKEAKKNKKADFFMTPKTTEEFLSFFKENKEKEIAIDFLSLINIESPDFSKILFSSFVIEKIVSETRERSYRGLNIAEEEIENTAKNFLGKEIKNKKEFQIKIGEFIHRFRERYRKATRYGFLDSVADFEMIVLAKQKEGFLISADEGVIRWGRIFGAKEMHPLIFLKHFQFLLRSHQEQAEIKNQ